MMLFLSLTRWIDAKELYVSAWSGGAQLHPSSHSVSAVLPEARTQCESAWLSPALPPPGTRARTREGCIHQLTLSSKLLQGGMN